MNKSIEMLIYDYSFRVRLYEESLNRNKHKETNDLTPRELLILEIIGLKEGIKFSDITKLYPHSLSKSTISITISKLCSKKKLVEKIRPDNNQRIIIVKLTPKGEEVLSQIKNTQLKIYSTIVETLDLTPSKENVLNEIINSGIGNFNKMLGIDMLE